MIPYIDKTEKTIACTLVNPKFNVLDLAVDLGFVAGGIVTAAGAYYYFNPTQKPPELAQYTSTDMAVSGVEALLVSSIVHMFVPTISDKCR